MCASYGLDPRFDDAELLAAADAALLDDLRALAERNAGETLRPTGRNLRNLNPLITGPEGAPVLEQAWWGYLVDGAPARFPSINSRSERLLEQPAGLRSRAIVPATSWYEMQKPSRTWQEFSLGGRVAFGMAAVTRHGRTDDGTWFTCYSIVMRPAPEHLAHVHERMPVLIPTSFAEDWLTAEAGPDVMAAALEASDEPTARVSVAPRASDVADDPDRLF